MFVLLNVQALSLNMNLFLLRSRLLDRVIHFGENLGNQVKGHSSKKIKSLIEVPCLALLKVQVPSFNMNLFYSP